MVIKNKSRAFFLSFLSFLLVVFSGTQSAHAMGKFDKFMSDPRRAFLSVLAGLAAIAAVLVFSSWLGRLCRRMKARSAEGKEERKVDSQIPTGKIGDIVLPPAKLIRKDQDSDLQAVCHIRLDRELTIGRDEANDLVIETQTVSKKHAKIRPEKDSYMLYDLGSTTGTYVNDKEVTRHLLKEDDVIRIGHSDLTFNQSYSGEERRRAPRVDLNSKVRYLTHSQEGPAEEAHSYAVNLSAVGIQLRTEKQLARGTILELEIGLPEVGRANAIGEVRWSNLDGDQFCTGVEFTNISRKAVDKITAYVHKKWVSPS